MISVKVNRAGFRFALRDALGGGFETVIHRIAHHVYERIADLLHHGAVKFGVIATGGKIDFLAEIGGEIAHEPFHFLERRLDGNHAQRHGGVLQFLGDARKLGDIALQHGPGVADFAGRFDQLALYDHQFADYIHEGIELVSADADRRTAARRI